MPIHHPGKKFRKHKLLSRRKSNRDVVAILSLTAMVDMFTVLVIFLLMSYKETGVTIYIPDKVDLPEASATEELSPATVVTFAEDIVYVDDKPIIYAKYVKAQEDWMIKNLYIALNNVFKAKENSFNVGIRNEIRGAINLEKEDFKKVTLQADRNVDFLSLKKVMYTITESGASEIKFAVLQGKEEGF